MKFAVIIAFVCMAAYASGEVCHCAGFFDHEVNEEHKLHAAPAVRIAGGCDDAGKEACKEKCREAYVSLTNNGTLSHVTVQGNTVAQAACAEHGGNVSDGVLTVRSKFCGNEWEFVGNALGRACCLEGEAIPCPEATPSA